MELRQRDRKLVWRKSCSSSVRYFCFIYQPACLSASLLLRAAELLVQHSFRSNYCLLLPCSPVWMYWMAACHFTCTSVHLYLMDMDMKKRLNKVGFFAFIFNQVVKKRVYNLHIKVLTFLYLFYMLHLWRIVCIQAQICYINVVHLH